MVTADGVFMDILSGGEHQKARPKFPHATAAKTTVTGKPEVTVFAPGFY